MITIQPYQQVNDIKFQMTLDEVMKKLGTPDKELAGPNGNKRLFWGAMEVEFQDTNILSIAFNDIENILINEKPVSILKPNLLQQENPYFQDNTYVFPKWGIMLYNLDDYKNGFEIRFFPMTCKDEFIKEDSTLPHYSDLNRKMDDPHPLFVIKPYLAAGPLAFGMSSAEVENIIGKASDSIVIRGELREKRKKIGTAYNNSGKLVQVSFENFEGVFLGGTDISKKGNFSPLFKDKEAFINRSYTIYFDIGVAFQNFEKKGVRTIVVFSEEKVDFWKNLHMPIF